MEKPKKKKKAVKAPQPTATREEDLKRKTIKRANR
jgi:hypothetical protein